MLPVENRSLVLSELAAEAVSEATDIWPGINERLTGRGARGRRRTPSAALTAVAAVVVVALLAIVGFPFGSATEDVSAETILERAESATSAGTTAVSTYHLLMTRTSKDAGISTSEVWYGGPTLQRTTQQTVGPNDGIISRQDVVFNGVDTWIEDTEGGVTRVIHTIGTEWTRPAERPSDQPNLTEVLRTFGDKRAWQHVWSKRQRPSQASKRM